MNDHTNPALDSAREALDECARMLQSDCPNWAAVHEALGVAVRAVAVAEYVGNQRTEEPLPPPPAIEPPLPTEPELVFEVPAEAPAKAPAEAPTEAPSEAPAEAPGPERERELAPQETSVCTPEPAAVEEEGPAKPEPLPAAGASLAERLSEQPLENLKTSLSINNRVRFASLLTDGDVPSLMGLCEALERSANFEAAQVLLLETAGDVNWEDEESGAAEFLTLVRRLFASK